MTDDGAPFDIAKATFYLVVAVFLLYGMIVIGAMGICAMHMGEMPTRCIKEGGLMEALTTLLASALAFAAGRTTTK